MDLYEAIKERRSIRKYKNKPVEPEKLNRVLEMAHLAPSAKNVQPWKIILVNENNLQDKLVEAAGNQKFLAEAPYSVVICSSTKKCYQQHGEYMTSFAVDAAIFMDHLTLAAHAEGLGTCWIANFDESAVRDLLEVPEEYKIVVLTPLGYPGHKGKFGGRKPLSKIIFRNKWGQPLK